MCIPDADMTKDNLLAELKDTYRKIGWELPKGLYKLNAVRISFLLHDAKEELERLEREELGEHVGPDPKSAADEADEDDEVAGEPPAPRQPYPDRIEDCANDLRSAFRLYFKRRLWLVDRGNYDAPEVKELKRLASEYVRRAVGRVIEDDGSGYQRGSTMMYLVDRAITEMRNEFMDTLVASTVMATVMSDRHCAEIERIRRSGEPGRKEGKEAK